VFDWTIALFFRPDITKVELRVEREQGRGRRERQKKFAERCRFPTSSFVVSMKAKRGRLKQGDS
jgi:hypothetical protein